MPLALWTAIHDYSGAGHHMVAIQVDLLSYSGFGLHYSSFGQLMLVLKRTLVSAPSSFIKEETEAQENEMTYQKSQW